MKKLLVKIVIVWCLKLATSAPIDEENKGREARQWMQYDELPLYAIYPDHQEPMQYPTLIQYPIQYPYYNSAELNSQLAEPLPYNQFIYYNQPLHYAPHVHPSKLKPSVQIIDKGSKISTILKSKLKIAQKLLGMFGIKLGEQKPLLPHKETAQANVVADYNTVSILPERLGTFLAKLKEESIQRSQGIYDVPDQKFNKQKEGTLNAMISVNLEQPKSSSNNRIVSSQQVRSNDVTLIENDFEEKDKEIDEIRVLSDEDIGELIRFFDIVRDIYDKSGPHSPTDTIEIKIMAGQPKNLVDNDGDKGKTECDFDSSEESDDDRIIIKSSKCKRIMSLSLSQQAENNRQVEETRETTDLAVGLKGFQDKNLDQGKTGAQQVIQSTTTTDDLATTESSRMDIGKHEDISTETSTEEIIRSLDTSVNTKLESTNDGSPRILLKSSTTYSITESTSTKLSEPAAEAEIEYTTNENHTSQTGEESKNIEPPATYNLLQTATSLY